MRFLKIVFLSLILGLSACESEGSLEPTVFSGQVLYSDSREPVSNAEVTITSIDRRVGNNINLETERFELDSEDEGRFSITFEVNEAIDAFDIVVTTFDNDKVIIQSYVPSNGLICSPNECVDFAPGLSHENVLLLIPDSSN